MNMYAFDEDGVDKTLVRLDGTDNAMPQLSVSSGAFSPLATTWSRFSKPRSITKQGKTKVEYFSVDKRGNVERKKTRYIQIDTGNPKIYFTAKSRYRKNKVIKIKATDSVSGMRYINVAISTPDRGYEKSVRGSKASYKLSRRGRWLLRIEAHDWAGNVKVYSKRIRVY
jgi:hypothetical protein